MIIPLADRRCVWQYLPFHLTPDIFSKLSHCVLKFADRVSGSIAVCWAMIVADEKGGESAGLDDNEYRGGPSIVGTIGVVSK